MDTLLKLSPVWHFFLPSWLLCRVSIIHTKGRALLIHALFENTIPFCMSITCLLFLLFFIAKGLAMCRLGGVINTQIVLFKACLLQVLSTFCVLINLNNTIDTLRSQLCYQSYFVYIFVVLQANCTTFFKPIQMRRTRAKLEAA